MQIEVMHLTRGMVLATGEVVIHSDVTENTYTAVFDNGQVLRGTIGADRKFVEFDSHHSVVESVYGLSCFEHRNQIAVNEVKGS